MEFFENLIGYRFTPDSYYMATLSFLMGLVSIAALCWMANRKQKAKGQGRGTAAIARYDNGGVGRVSERGMRMISVFFLVVWPLVVFVFMGESIETPAMENG